MILKKNNTKNNKEIVVGSEADEKLLDTKIIEAKDLTDKNKSILLNQNKKS